MDTSQAKEASVIQIEKSARPPNLARRCELLDHHTTSREGPIFSPKQAYRRTEGAFPDRPLDAEFLGMATAPPSCRTRGSRNSIIERFQPASLLPDPMLQPTPNAGSGPPPPIAALMRPAVLPVAVFAWLAATAWLRPLSLPDEGRYVGVALEMLWSGNWLVPTLDTLPYFHKPPLFYWVTAASLATFGINEWAARLGSLLAATGC